MTTPSANAEMLPSDPNWHSDVEPPLQLEDPDSAEWFDSADVVVVGFGGAGVCAAIEARSHGAEVIAVDRYSGGGATAISGGVYYGGGTSIQKNAGIDDSAAEMFNYLKMETQGVVKDETLRKFCNESAANLEWLMNHGVRFGQTVYEKKTIYPPDGYFLYYSGNELLADYRAVAKPAPRGHRTIGKGLFAGQYMFPPLRASAERLGVRVLAHSPVKRLVQDSQGAIVGVEINQLLPGSKAYRQHDDRFRRFQRFLRFSKPAALAAVEKQQEIEKTHGIRRLIRARRGVVLSTGSFAFNREMVRYYTPAFYDAMPLGSAGCDGSGMRLGQSVGGVTGEMTSVSLWRSISPPQAFVNGIIVDKAAKRFVEEDAYSARIGDRVQRHEHTAYLIIDRQSYVAAWRFAALEGLFPLGRFPVEAVPVLLTLIGNCKRAETIAALAAHYGLPAQALEQTVADYNAGAARGEDAIGKTKTYLRALGPGPYYIIDISTCAPKNNGAHLPLGGLKVDEDTGNVVRKNGERIPGLFAAGRVAVGIPSRFYVSGSSIADCVFSGRRAGAHAAEKS